MTTKLTNLIRKFHHDEEGLEALQVVMIIAIAAMVMIACATLGKSAVTWMQGKWNTLQGTDISGGAGGATSPTSGFPSFPSGLPSL
jgi:Flp pilus assembly pilin Flp